MLHAAPQLLTASQHPQALETRDLFLSCCRREAGGGIGSEDLRLLQDENLRFPFRQVVPLHAPSPTHRSATLQGVRTPS